VAERSTGDAQAPAASSSRSSDKADRKPMYDDKAKVAAIIERCRKDARANTARQVRDRADLLNLRMYRGGEANQWLVWDGQSNNYIERPTEGDAGLPAWFMRATSNFLANKIDGISAIQNQSQPNKNFFAKQDDDASRAAAEVAEFADPVLLDEIGYPHDLRPRLNKLVALTNLAGLVLTYDTDPKWGTEPLPLLQCTQCGEYTDPMDAPGEDDMCPDCGGPLEFPPMDETGTPPHYMAPKGKIDAELVNSFEISLPRSADTAHEERLPWLSTHRRWSVEEVCSRWPQAKQVLRNDARQTGGKMAEQSFADQTRNLSSPVSAGSPAQSSGSQPTATGPIVWRLWHDPIDDDEFYFPDGLFATELEAEKFVLEAVPLPFTDDEGRPFKNIVLRQYTTSPGSAWGKPPADDLVPLQKQLNLAQSLAFLILMHHASPRTWVPTSVTIHDPISGVPGKTHSYTSLRPGDKPVTEDGRSFPEGLRWFLEFLIKTFDDISKLNAVLMGQRPEGDPTLGEVEILQERGFAAFQETLEALVSFEKRLSLKMLWIARESAWAPRFKRLLNKENGEWEFKQFTGADLEGGVDIDIELASAWPRSPMLLNLRLNKAVELGMLDPQDPEVRETYLRLNDLTEFKASIDADEKQVGRHLEIWKATQNPADIKPPQKWWNVGYHFFRKSQFLKSDLFEQLEVQAPAVAQAMLSHVEQLHTLMQPPAPEGEAVPPAKGANGALASALASGQLKPAAGPPAKGSGGALRQALTSGRLRPVGPKGSRGALRHALGHGRLRPAMPAAVAKAKASAAPPGAGNPNAPGGGGNPAGATP
jgi:hypothetical protein